MIRCAEYLLIGLALLLGTLFCLAELDRFACNVSPSVPRGCYWVEPGGSLQAGQIAMACPPERESAVALRRGYLGPGRCPGGTKRVLKVVAAVGGDQVEFARGGVTINGDTWPCSQPWKHDSVGRPMTGVASSTRALGHDEVVLLSRAAYCQGFDARYWGAVARASVIGPAEPLWIWE
ncbi:MAG: conjugative transfer signal peptidase TraF [Myxococcales bacterium]|nr:conjugative transfer signal peptidase TraF [Myxococcales bacterium]